ncbi:MAG: hypothetical protein ACRD12_11845 [Acidimicrobiales bacterium]
MRARGEALLVALTVSALVLTGCGRAATPPSPDIPPLGRLGRWDGATFAPVTPGGITSGHLYVLVHGWAAGYSRAVDEYPGPGPLLAWDPQARNGRGEQFLEVWLAPMAAALSQLDPLATVVAFSWIDQSATTASPFGARISQSRTVPNGERLGIAMNEALSAGFAEAGGRVHVLGHSHGAKVATIGSLALTPPPAQLTLFDSVDTVVPALAGADNHLVPYLRRLPIGRGPGMTFVDNYFSEFGRAYGNDPGLSAIVDVSLPPDEFSRWELQDRHLYPPRWYTAAAQQPAAGVGPQWSPLLGTTYERLGPYYVTAAAGDAAEQLVLKPATRPAAPTPWSFVRHWAWPLADALLLVVLVPCLLIVGRRRRAVRRG